MSSIPSPNFCKTALKIINKQRTTNCPTNMKNFFGTKYNELPLKELTWLIKKRNTNYIFVEKQKPTLNG